MIVELLEISTYREGCITVNFEGAKTKCIVANKENWDKIYENLERVNIQVAGMKDDVLIVNIL